MAERSRLWVVLRLTGLQVKATAKRLIPFFLPSPVCYLEGGSVTCRQRLHQSLKSTSGLKARIYSEIASYYLFHVELAHLNLVARKFLEESLLSVDNKPLVL